MKKSRLVGAGGGTDSRYVQGRRAPAPSSGALAVPADSRARPAAGDVSDPPARSGHVPARPADSRAGRGDVIIARIWSYR